MCLLRIRCCRESSDYCRSRSSSGWQPGTQSSGKLPARMRGPATEGAWGILVERAPHRIWRQLGGLYRSTQHRLEMRELYTPPNCGGREFFLGGDHVFFRPARPQQAGWLLAMGKPAGAGQCVVRQGGPNPKRQTRQPQAAAAGPGCSLACLPLATCAAQDPR
jgi:hypothetical protein